MAGLMHQFIGVLEEQLTLYKELIRLSEAKKEHVIQNSIEGLSAITSEENITVGKLQKLDKNRISIFRDIANVLNQDINSLTLTKLADVIKGQPEYPVLIEIIEETKKVFTQLKTVNDQNRVLIENSLEYIDFTMNIIRSSLMKEPSFYTMSGEEIGSSKGFFDAKQ